MASIVLIFSHPSLDHPEATVRTCFAGQSSQPLERRWPWPGDFFLERFFRFACSVRVGRDGIDARWKPPCNFLLGVSKGSSETESAPDRDRPTTLVSRGSSAVYPGRNRPDIYFQGAPFEVRRVGSRNGRAVVP